MEPKRIILGVSASIAIYKACDLITTLKHTGYDVTVIMTKESEELIRPVVFQSLSGNQVFCGMFEQPASWDISHVSFAARADFVLIAPATANIIAKLAGGICDDLLSCVVLATKAPVLIAPAMNENMYKHKATQQNIKILKSFGYKFIGPKKGRLACGIEGIGHIADVDEIVKEVKRLI